MRIKPGLLFLAPDGEHWLTCRRPRPEACLQLVNLHSGELRPYCDVDGITFVSLSLDTLLRLIPAKSAP